jgi:hypothetical protein
MVRIPATVTSRENFEIMLYNIWLCPSGTVVAHSTHKPKVKGSKPATVTSRENFEKMLYNIWLCPGGTVVAHSAHKPKVKGSKPATVL